MIWIVMAITGLLNFGSRFVMFSDIAPKQLPPKLEEALAYVPIAVLTAIILPSVLIDDNDAIDIETNPRLPAAIIAIIVALLTRSVPTTIASGLVALWLSDWLFF